jgi:transposase
VKDAEWIAELVCCGLIRPSFVPPQPLRELRELLRYRRKLTEAQAAERNRLQKQLEIANPRVKRPGAGPLGSVATDVFGVSGRAIVRALIDNTTSPMEMADLARGRLRNKRDELTHALKGRLDDTQRFLLSMQLRRVEDIEQLIETLDQRIAEKLAPYQAEMALLMQIPGVDWVVAAVLIAELGVDPRIQVSGGRHGRICQRASLAAWAGLCPGSHESAGKHRSTAARKGNVHLRTMLVGAARPAARTKGSYFKDKYYRLKARRGSMRAAVAIAHKILVAAYHMLARRVDYRDLGEAYLDQIDQTRTAANLKRRLERLGYIVSISPQHQGPDTNTPVPA